MCKWIEINSYIILYHHYINNEYEFFVVHFMLAGFTFLIMIFKNHVEKTLNLWIFYMSYIYILDWIKYI